jgi:hypothetical protein
MWTTPLAVFVSPLLGVNKPTTSAVTLQRLESAALANDMQGQPITVPQAILGSLIEPLTNPRSPSSDVDSTEVPPQRDAELPLHSAS